MPAFLYSSIAQSVEHAAVNRRVVGSSPTGGANQHLLSYDDRCFFVGILLFYIQKSVSKTIRFCFHVIAALPSHSR